MGCVRRVRCLGLNDSSAYPKETLGGQYVNVGQSTTATGRANLDA